MRQGLAAIRGLKAVLADAKANAESETKWAADYCAKMVQWRDLAVDAAAAIRGLLADGEPVHNLTTLEVEEFIADRAWCAGVLARIEAAMKGGGE